MTQGPGARLRFGRNRIAAALAAIAGVAVVAIGVAFWLSGSTAAGPKADPENAAQVALGREIYARRCATCHGKQLEGQPSWRVRKADGRLPAPPHDETGHSWHHTDRQLFEITKGGLTAPLAPPGYQSDMPAFGGVLTDDEIWAVLAFIKTSWPDRIRVRQRQMTEASDER